MPGRHHRARETASVLVVACVVAGLFDAEGLLNWARSLDVGPTQAALLKGLGPLNAMVSSLGFSVPRRWASETRKTVSHWVGGEGDPVLAEGWASAELPVAPSPVTDEARSEEVVEPQLVPEPVGGVLLLGDSMMAGSLGSTLERALERSEGFHVSRAAQLGTGLARPEVYDWMKVLPALMARERPRYVVVSLGSNDATNLRDGDEQIDFGESRWRQIYTERVEAMMRSLAGQQTHVLWLTLPPMREKRLSARALLLNRIFAECAGRVPRVELLELSTLVTDRERERKFSTFVHSPDGRLLRYRLDDGVHFATAGSRVVSNAVVDRLRKLRESVL